MNYKEIWRSGGSNEDLHHILHKWSLHSHLYNKLFPLTHLQIPINCEKQITNKEIFRQREFSTFNFWVEVDLIWRAADLIDILFWSLAHEYTNTSLCAGFSLLVEHDFQIRWLVAKGDCFTAIISRKIIMEEQGRRDKIINEILFNIVFLKLNQTN